MIAAAIIGLAGIAAGVQIDPGIDVGVNAVIAVDQFVVINNTNGPLTCAHKDGSAWSAWFVIAAGAEWNETDFDFGGDKRFQCRPPVRGVVYRIVAGKRYSLLRNNRREVDLVEVTAGP
ncbi:MAG: hypothetical protein ACJ8E3_05995 [Sphingomicrobium sp.]